MKYFVVELIVAKREAKKDKVPETIEEIELEVFSALESLVEKEIPEKESEETVPFVAELNRVSEILQETEKNDSSLPSEYFHPQVNQSSFDYEYSSDELNSVYDSNNSQETDIKEEIYEEIKANKLANTFNLHTPSKGDPSLAKKAAQELYKTINFTMNTVLYDLVEV